MFDLGKAATIIYAEIQIISIQFCVYMELLSGMHKYTCFATIEVAFCYKYVQY